VCYVTAQTGFFSETALLARNTMSASAACGDSGFVNFVEMTQPASCILSMEGQTLHFASWQCFIVWQPLGLCYFVAMSAKSHFQKSVQIYACVCRAGGTLLLSF
jgi:hypothetical protein